MVVRIPDYFRTNPGEALSAAPYEGEMLLNFTGPLGSTTGMTYKLIFQLGKWGFYAQKIDEWINVSPVFKQYYDITIQQKQALEAQIKSGLAQIAAAIHDYELVSHDLRKYKEFIEYFTKIEKGNILLKGKDRRNRGEGEQLLKEGEHTLRAIFIDEVDVHTGETVALKSIAPRWPTIIADFMRLNDDDKDPGKIREKLKVSEAEGVVLSTKNKLYLEWRDKLFKPTVTERYNRIMRLVEARRMSIAEYSNMLKPAISRFKMINDALESQGPQMRVHPIFGRSDSQAFSIDFTRLWAWKTFAPSEKYKITRESVTEISAREDGFNSKEIAFIKEKLSHQDKLSMDEELFLKGRVVALPVKPSIDDIIRKLAKDVEKEYKVTIDDFDIFKARTKLSDNFTRRASETQETGFGQGMNTGKGITPGQSWVFSPYFVFVDVPMYRTVLRFPDGTELEDLWIENLRTATRSQNLVIVNMLELIAREKQLDNYIRTMLGEVSEKDLKTIEELTREQFPEVFGKPHKPTLKVAATLEESLKKIRAGFGDVLRSFGLTGSFVDVLRARGPYEFALDDRITEVIQPAPGEVFHTLVGFLQQSAGVPGAKW